MKTAILLLALLAVSPSFAQSLSSSQQESISAASNAGNNQGVTINQAASPALTHVTTDGSLKTTGQAIAPGVYNASGTYNCFGGASIAAGWMGGAVSGGTTVEQTACYRMHLMDKARARGQTVVYDALFCQFPDGKAAYEAAGLACPTASQKRADAAAVNVSQAVTCDSASDPIVRDRLCKQGK
jgi:hypothetical protein